MCKTVILVALQSHWNPFGSFQADLNCNVQEETGAFYGVTSQYESPENMTITCSTKVCSFGKQVVEKVEVGFYVQYVCLSANQDESYGGIRLGIIKNLNKWPYKKY